MKKIFVLVLLASTAFIAIAQNGNALPAVDKSPMDMSYYPVNYPVLKIRDKATEPMIARVIYSRPQKNGRTIFGDLVQYGEVWRMGANEATEIEFYKDVRISGKKVPKGRYTLYAIANPETWTMILNKETDTWGAFKYDMKKDLLRTVVNVQKSPEAVESLVMTFEKSAAGFNLVIAWDDIRIALPVSLK